MSNIESESRTRLPPGSPASAVVRSRKGGRRARQREVEEAAQVGGARPAVVGTRQEVGGEGQQEGLRARGRRGVSAGDVSGDPGSHPTQRASRALTLLMTARCVRPARMWNQMPMSWARSATGRRYSHTNLRASRRISTQLLSRAKSGASGQAATKMVTNPNCSTAGREEPLAGAGQPLGPPVAGMA